MDTEGSNIFVLILSHGLLCISVLSYVTGKFGGLTAFRVAHDFPWSSLGKEPPRAGTNCVPLWGRHVCCGGPQVKVVGRCSFYDGVERVQLPFFSPQKMRLETAN